MSELRDAGHMLEVAERAAIAGDLASAEELLRDAARIQEAELGPLHPDLANTLNNLAIVVEKSGRPGDAETFYRRAVAIASASLPADHPMIAASRENLEDFCRASGLSIDAPAFITPPARDTALGLDAFAPEGAAGAAETTTDVPAADAALTTQATTPPSGTPWPVPRPPTPTTSELLPPAPRRISRWLACVAIGVVALAAVTLLVRRPWSSRETSISAPTSEPTAPQAAEPARPARAEPSAMPAPIEQARPPAVVPRSDDRDVLTDKPPAPATSSSAITLATSELCQTFSTSGGKWRCDPAADSVSPGPIVLYTRIYNESDPMAVSVGTKIGVYEIVAHIGSGGMARSIAHATRN